MLGTDLGMDRGEGLAKGGDGFRVPAPGVQELDECPHDLEVLRESVGGVGGAAVELGDPGVHGSEDGGAGVPRALRVLQDPGQVGLGGVGGGRGVALWLRGLVVGVVDASVLRELALHGVGEGALEVAQLLCVARGCSLGERGDEQGKGAHSSTHLSHNAGRAAHRPPHPHRP